MNQKVCEECGHVLYGEEELCPNCGYPLKDVNSQKSDDNICPECGKAVTEENDTCPNCGYPLKASSHTSEAYDFDNVQGDKKRKGLIALLVVLIVCILSSGAYLIYVSSSIDKDAIVEFTPEFIKSIGKYDKLCPFSEGLAAVGKNGRWGYIDTKGKEVIPCDIIALFAGEFSEEMACVITNKTSGNVEHSDGGDTCSLHEVYFINQKGKEVFSCNMWYCETYHYDDIAQFDLPALPKFNNGEVFIPIGHEKYAVFDKDGNRLRETTSEPIANGSASYSLFENEKVFYEAIAERHYGLKDSTGKQILLPEYDAILSNKDGKFFTNGVVVVCMREMRGTPRYDFSCGVRSSNEIMHYGYADLKGNDTFLKELKSSCQKLSNDAHQLVANQIQQEEREREEERLRQEKLEREGPEWLQGTWRLCLSDDRGNSSYLYMYFDHGNCTSEINDFVISQTYSVVDGVLYLEKGHMQLDESQQRLIGADGRAWEKVSDGLVLKPSSNYSSGSNFNYTKNEEMKILKRLKELGDESRKYIDELATMRRTGQVNPMSYSFINQALINIKDEQIRLSRELGDEQMASEYIQQKDQLMRAMNMMYQGY